MRILKRGLAALLILTLILSVFTYWFVSHQGRQAVNWERYSTAKVLFDNHGIPTIEASDWKTAIQAQGFVTASERLWQMDLLRRSGAGKLAEWFGNTEKVIAFDEKRRLEDWMGVADRAAQELPPNEKANCDAFATGVNQFIEGHPRRWGVEYLVLGVHPERWECRDSLLILLTMVEDLTEVFEEEAQGSVWRKFLSPSWEQFLFTMDHPWNVLLFEKGATVKRIELPQEPIPASPLNPEDAAEPFDGEDFVPGSNAWAYRGSQGTFLASDPHLGYGVPQLWYPLRMKKSENEWTAGVAIPGLPGIVIGRNAQLAWGFTNVKEDVDDLLEEEISEDGKSYLASAGPGRKKEWKLIEERPYEIQIKGAPSRQGVARFTHRGPLSARKYLGKAQYSRQWLGFKSGILRLPALYEATDWESFNMAADAFAAPAQAMVYAHQDGSLGVRVSGRGVRRKKSGLIPQPAIEGEWLAIEPPTDRRRLHLPAGPKPIFVSTANQRLWKRGFGEHWSADVRQERIASVLSSSGSLSREDMAKLQHDTHSRFLQTFLQWVGTHATPKTDKQKALLESWKSWDGVAATNEAVFAQAVLGRNLFASMLLGRVRRQFLPAAAHDVLYHWKMDGAWQLRLWEGNQGDPLTAFGVKSTELADWLLQEIEKQNPQSYSVANRWMKQHPFAKSIPILGSLFAVDEHPQVGFGGLVRVEKPTLGASTRIIFDMAAPDGGQWAFPVGQSGHVLSPYYKNFRKLWYAEKYLPVR